MASVHAVHAPMGAGAAAEGVRTSGASQRRRNSSSSSASLSLRPAPNAELVQAGSQGTVRVGEWDGRMSAIKSYSTGHERAWAVEVNAATVIANRHAHILTYYQCSQGVTGRLVHCELALCDVFELYRATGCKGLGEASFIREWCLQLAHALQFLHSNLVAHRDVKPENALIIAKPVEGTPKYLPAGSKAEHLKAKRRLLAAATALASDSGTASGMHDYMLKMCDFGSAFVAPSADREAGSPLSSFAGRTPRGSSKYACPQVCWLHAARRDPDRLQEVWETAPTPAVATAGYNPFAADVWSFGVTVFVLVTGRHPFRLASVEDKGYRAFIRTTQYQDMELPLLAPGSSIWAEHARLRWMWPSGISPGLQHLLLQCLRADETQRASMAEIVAHPWFGDPAWVPPAPVHPVTTSPVRVHSPTATPPSDAPATGSGGGSSLAPVSTELSSALFRPRGAFAAVSNPSSGGSTPGSRVPSQGGSSSTMHSRSSAGPLQPGLSMRQRNPGLPGQCGGAEDNLASSYIEHSKCTYPNSRTSGQHTSFIMAADGAASVDAGTVAERVRMAQSVAVSNERYTAKIPFNLVTVSVDRAATVAHKRGIYSIVLSSVGVEGGAESLELFKSYSDLVPLSTQAKTVPQLKGMLLPAAGWFETTDDGAVMTKRMMAIQSFLQATLVAVTTVPSSEVPLKIIKTLCGDSFPATA